MPNEVDDYKRSRVVRYFLVSTLSLGFILAGLLIENASDTPPHMSFIQSNLTWIRLCSELGVAFLIALTVMLTIEAASREEFSKTVNKKIAEIQENVIKATFSRSLPKALVDEVDRLILRTDFIRRNHRGIYNLRIRKAMEISPNLGTFEVVEVVIITDYVIKNVSGVLKDYEIRYEIDKLPLLELEDVARIESVQVDGKEVLDLEKDTSDTKGITRSDYLDKFTYKIKNMKPDSEVRIVTKSTQFKSLDAQEIWRTFLPSDGMNLRVTLPEDRLTCKARAMNRVELTKMPSNEECGHHEWDLNNPVLPYQGIVFWWRVKGTPC